MKHQRDVDVALDWPNPGPVSTHKKQASKHYYPLVMANIAMGNGSFMWNFPFKIVIFHSYVSLPQGPPIQVDIFLEYVPSAGNEN